MLDKVLVILTAIAAVICVVCGITMLNTPGFFCLAVAGVLILAMLLINRIRKDKNE